MNRRTLRLRIGLWAELGLGLVLGITALQHYVPLPRRMYEMTFLSNMLGGTGLVLDSLLRLRKKRGLPGWLLLTLTTALLVVVLITVGCTLTGYRPFGLTVGMAFLHVLNPLGAVLWFVLWGPEQKLPGKQVFLAPGFSMAYLLFDWLRSLRVGRYVYGLLPISKMTPPLLLLAALTAYLGLLLLSTPLLLGHRGKGEKS